MINRLSRLFFACSPAALADIRKTNVTLNELGWGSAVSGDPKDRMDVSLSVQLLRAFQSVRVVALSKGSRRPSSALPQDISKDWCSNTVFLAHSVFETGNH